MTADVAGQLLPAHLLRQPGMVPQLLVLSIGYFNHKFGSEIDKIIYVCVINQLCNSDRVDRTGFVYANLRFKISALCCLL